MSLFQNTHNNPVQVAAVRCFELSSAFNGPTSSDHVLFREFAHFCRHYQVDKLSAIFVTVTDKYKQEGTFGPIDLTSARCLLERLAPLVLGRVFRRPDDCTTFFRRSIRHSHTGELAIAISAFELAMWDLVSRRDQISIRSMAMNDYAPQELNCYASFLGHDPSGPSAHLLSSLASTCHLVHSKFATPLIDHKSGDLVRKIEDILGGEQHVALDCFQTWDTECLKLVSDLESAERILWLEEPIPVERILSEESITCSVPLAYGEHAYNAFELTALSQKREIQIITPEFGWCCSLPECVNACRTLSTEGDLRIALHGAFLPVARTIAPLLGDDMVVEFHCGLEFQRQYFFEGKAFPNGDGRISSSDEFGWGITFRQDAKIRENHIGSHS